MIVDDKIKVIGKEIYSSATLFTKEPTLTLLGLN
jgi:hypothetical protein